MKKIFKLIAVICITIFLLIACGEKEKTNNLQEEQVNNSQATVEQENNNENEVIIAEETELTKVFSNVETFTGLDKATILSQDELNENFNFDGIEGIEKEIRSKEAEDTISEVAIVKLQDKGQSEKVMQVFLKRYSDLQVKYADNEEMLKVINNADNYILKQEGGYITFILSENANEIDEKIKETF